MCQVLYCAVQFATETCFNVLFYAWIFVAVVAALSVGCIKKKRPSRQKTGAQLSHLPSHHQNNLQKEAAASVPPPALAPPQQPLALKPFQPISNISFLRVPHEYIKDLEIKGVIGQGASGRSYLGSYRGIPVAVKIVDYNVRHSNEKLLKAMKVLQIPTPHPNILHTYRIAVIELRINSRALLLPKRIRRIEQPREAVSTPSSGFTATGNVDLIDDYCESDETWDNDARRSFDSSMGSSPCSTRVSDEIPREGGGEEGSAAAAPQPGRIIHLWDLMPHPKLNPEEIYVIEEEEPSADGDIELRSATSAPTAASGSGTVQSTLKRKSQSETLAGRFPASALSKPLRPGMYEVWIISEFADKGSMEDHVFKKKLVTKSDGTPDEEVILRVLLDVANGMAEFHRRGIIHGDLKASNVMIVSSSTDPRGWVAKVSDAALLPLIDLTLTENSIKHRARLQCLSPEYVLKDETSCALDTYCFAMLMWKCWTGKRVFRDMELSFFIKHVIAGGNRPEVPTDCPAAYAELMQRCWAAEPGDRPSFEEICGKLKEQLQKFEPSGSSSSVTLE